MKLLKRLTFFLIFVIRLAPLTISAAEKNAPEVKTRKKVDNMDPALRMKWFDQHMAMKQQTPFKVYSKKHGFAWSGIFLMQIRLVDVFFCRGGLVSHGAFTEPGCFLSNT